MDHMRPAMSHDEEEELWMFIDLAADHRSAARLNDEVTCLMAGIGKPFSEATWNQMVPELVLMWQGWQEQMDRINKRKGQTGKSPAEDAKTLGKEAAAIAAETNDDMIAFVNLACKTIIDNPSLTFQQKMEMMQTVGERNTGNGKQ